MQVWESIVNSAFKPCYSIFAELINSAMADIRNFGKLIGAREMKQQVILHQSDHFFCPDQDKPQGGLPTSKRKVGKVGLPGPPAKSKTTFKMIREGKGKIDYVSMKEIESMYLNFISLIFYNFILLHCSLL